MADENRNDLVLSPNEYAYVLDTTKGQVSVYVGPNKTSLSNSDRLVQYNHNTNRFEPCKYDVATKLAVTAPEGWYMLLKNPEKDNKHPASGTVAAAPDTICVGKKINVKGPCSFALYPGQVAKVIQGHTLRSNQYLLVRVYDSDAANKNAKKKKYTTGDLMVIKGVDCSFYIPETGFEVLPYNGNKYVRDAVTLERLEYCILKDEDGNKRYVHGPDVVFPKPTEIFVTQGDSVKYKAIELSEISGVYVKVIADYSDDNKIEHHIGEELFITGADQMIYYPRPEHALISYNSNNVYHAIAIPEGEGRYVMNRITGEIKTVVGPKMLLPDPRTEVIVNRKLTKSECELWYPGNKEVLTHNGHAILNAVTLDTCVSATAKSLSTSALNSCINTSSPSDSATNEAATFNRNNKYTPPRTITLDNKYSGVVSIDVWTGYAINVVSKDGTKKVVCGPQTVILDYDQMLETVFDASGKKTVFLQYQNNRIYDKLNVETSDFVPACIDVVYNVDFDLEQKDKWFAVSNYADMLKSKMKTSFCRKIKSMQVQEFYDSYSDVLYNVIDNNNVFDSNGMIVSNMDIMSFELDSSIREVLDAHKKDVIRNNLNVMRAQSNYDTEKKVLDFQNLLAKLSHESELAKIDMTMAEEAKNHEEQMAAMAFEEDKNKKQLEYKRENDALESELCAKRLEREKAQQEQELALRAKSLEQEAKAKEAYAATVASVIQAISPDLIAAMQANSNAETLQQVSKAIAPLAIAKNEGVAETINTLLRGTSLENVFDSLVRNYGRVDK